MAKNATLDRAQIPSNCLPLIEQLIQDYPDFCFRTGKKFAFRFAFGAKNAKPTVFLGPPQPYFALQTLHELAHGLCGHKDWSNCISRLKCEREAWERAKTLFFKYQKLIPDPWNEDFVETSLDTYRNWVHQKTLCPVCGLTRFQDENGIFHCPECENFL